jgi:hypothetical protein
MWKLQNLEDYDRQIKWCSKKRPKELAATIRNLTRFFDALCAGGKVQNLVAANRFLHPEQAGVIAVDQKGGARNLAEMRLYTYPDDTTETLYLITIGDKNTQTDDVRFSKESVVALREAQTDGPERTISPPDG